MGAVGQAKDARSVLITDLLAWIHNGFEQVIGTKFSSYGGEIRSDGTSFTRDTVARLTATGTEHLTSIFKVSFPGNSTWHPGCHILHGPILDEGAWLKCKLRIGLLRLGFDNLL